MNGPKQRGSTPLQRKMRKRQATNKATRRVLRWNVVDVSAFIEHTCGLPHAAIKFRKAKKITGRRLLEINPSMLCGIGVHDFEEHKKILELVKRLRRGDTTLIPQKE